MTQHLPLPDLDWLKEHLEIDPSVPSCLRWCKNHGPIRAGRMAGSHNTNGYYQVRIKGKLYLVHRIICYLKHGKDPGENLVDHRKSMFDNTDIRIATYAQNSFYSKKQKNTTSKYKGVCWDRNKWRARIRYKGKVYNLGRFDNEEAAARAYDAKALELDPEFALLNLPPD